MGKGFFGNNVYYALFFAEFFSSDFNHSYTQQINKGYIYSRHIKEDKSLTNM